VQSDQHAWGLRLVGVIVLLCITRPARGGTVVLRPNGWCLGLCGDVVGAVRNRSCISGNRRAHAAILRWCGGTRV